MKYSKLAMLAPAIVPELEYEWMEASAVRSASLAVRVPLPRAVSLTPRACTCGGLLHAAAD